MNRKINKNSFSGVKGVTWSKEHSSWIARVAVRGTRHYLGRFSSLDDAKRAIEDKRLLLHGKFHNNG